MHGAPSSDDTQKIWLPLAAFEYPWPPFRAPFWVPFGSFELLCTPFGILLVPLAILCGLQFPHFGSRLAPLASPWTTRGPATARGKPKPFLCGKRNKHKPYLLSKMKGLGLPPGFQILDFLWI